jgi:hypothetical protein
MSTTNKLEIFATTTDGVGGVRLNAFALNAVSSGSTPGDFDADGDVDGTDLDALENNFGAAIGATLAMGDADGDADVDGADFLVWKQNVDSSAPASAIPEPSSILSIILAAMAACHVRRIHNRS